MRLTGSNIGKYLDLSALKTDTTHADIARMADLACQHRCACVFVFTAHIPFLLEYLGPRRQSLGLGGVVGFPTGSCSTGMKVKQTQELIELGVDEVDMVQNVSWLKSGNPAAVEADIRAVVAAAGGKPVKVILECHYLSDAEIAEACEIAIAAGVDYVKTGTGWAPTGATLDRVALMAETVAGRCKLKAAGGVRDRQTMEAMIDLGVTRFGIGVDTAVSILKSVEDDG
ncbi:deoxyribose-phosphate aldolase [Aliiruegeria sabulilitoris]|uniref:deoxyribose-phosphate aldolase n=1 Tax=Aliiruegeria sabulilitoris TaxID=1510458 RepID=UPI00082B42EE|nr:deoxyribose-phosphate aldolase [Aliiruegeria sabulilitoris]NDR56303.1 deoxyribose-phosphate aldolase [Pseudoruegeria sp. M32A2M]